MMRITLSVSFVAGFFLMVAIGDVSSGEMHKGVSSKALPPASIPPTPGPTNALPHKDVPKNEAVPERVAVDAGVDVHPDIVQEPDSDSASMPPAADASSLTTGSTAASFESAASAAALSGVSLDEMKLKNGKYVQRMSDGREVRFTVDTALQKYTESLFTQYDVPAGAAVVINSRTGRVMALSQERHVADAAPSSAVAFDASPPAASVFKIVTTAALVDNGIPLEKQTCYSGGSGGLKMQHIEDALPKNHACADVSTALGKSINAVFAKLSDKFLSRAVLQEYASRFGFNHSIDFDVPVETSAAEIPEERLERARTAAGFWHTHLSPLHAASIAQSLAQDGALLRPYIVESVTAASGETLYQAKTKYLRHIVSKETADRIRHALVQTTRSGTARKSFHDASGRPFLPGIEVAGKTGTLTGEKPYRAYTWFVGLAPLDKPEVAVAVLVVNEPKWRIKAPQLAALILKKYFDGRKSRIH